MFTNHTIIFVIIIGLISLAVICSYYVVVLRQRESTTKIIAAIMSMLITVVFIWCINKSMGDNMSNYMHNMIIHITPMPTEIVTTPIPDATPDVEETVPPSETQTDNNLDMEASRRAVFVIWIIIPFLFAGAMYGLCYLLLHMKKTKDKDSVKIVVIPTILFFATNIILYTIKLGVIDRTTIYYVWLDRQQKETMIIEETPYPTEMPTVEPIITEKSNDEPPTETVIKPDYTPYSNSEYGFSISYPSHFKAYNDGGVATLYTASSPSGYAREIIAAKPIEGETVNSSINDYIDSHSGEVKNKTLGDDYYTVRINDGDREYYKCCKFKNNNMYWFEFISLKQDHNIYDLYINDINNSFIIR